ncbi:MAG: hypothetical protein Q8P45_03315 [Candidatus Harrisonbacteria bacterium]|nr:hypothetical protein [Candidatus Harrisonbacteria bacterium]
MGNSEKFSVLAVVAIIVAAMVFALKTWTESEPLIRVERKLSEAQKILDELEDQAQQQNQEELQQLQARMRAVQDRLEHLKRVERLISGYKPKKEASLESGKYRIEKDALGQIFLYVDLTDEQSSSPDPQVVETVPRSFLPIDKGE